MVLRNFSNVLPTQAHVYAVLDGWMYIYVCIYSTVYEPNTVDSHLKSLHIEKWHKGEGEYFTVAMVVHTRLPNKQQCLGPYA